MAQNIGHESGNFEYVGAVTDISEQKRAEEAVRKSQEELAHITRMTTMGELAASIAHEVKQPLTAVINNANSCLGLIATIPASLDDIRDALKEIIDDTHRATSVMTRVRNLAKKAPAERKLIDLKDVVEDVFALARYESAQHRVTIKAEIPDDLPEIMGDRVQFQQVLLNLVLNGMDAMNSSDVVQRTLFITGHCSTWNGNPEVVISVKDTGPGIAPHEADHLFEPFYSTKPQGLGMGLAISRSIVEVHGGRIWHERDQRPGTTFSFSLPVEAGNSS